MQKSKSVLICSAIMLLAQVGCIFQQNDDRDQGWNINDPAYKYEPVTLSLTNKGEMPALHSSFMSWAQIKANGKNVLMSEPYCNCNDMCPLGASIASDVKPIFQDQTLSMEWDGVYWEANDQGCYTKRKFRKGTPLTAEFCAGQRMRADAIYDGTLDGVSCTPVEFAIGRDSKVSHSISPQWPTEPLEVEIVNQSGGELYFYGPGGCGGTPWLQVKQIGASGELETLPLRADCGAKMCTESGPVQAGCTEDLGCEAPTVVLPFETETLTWNQRAFIPTPRYSTTNQCQLEHLAPAGETEITICYQPAVPVVVGRITESCETRVIELGTTRRVRFEVK